MKDRRSRVERERSKKHVAARRRRAAVEARARNTADLDAATSTLTVATLSVRRPDPYIEHLDTVEEVAFKILDDGGVGLSELKRLPVGEAVSAALPDHHVRSVTEVDPVVIDQRDRKVFSVKVVPHDSYEDFLDGEREFHREFIEAFFEAIPELWGRCRCSWCRPRPVSRRTTKQELAREQWYPREDSNP